MHPYILQAMIHDQERQLEHGVRRAYVRRGSAETWPAPADPVVLRLCTVHDDEALERLAALEGHPAPRGRYVLAEVGGAVVAALPLGGGRLLADPFSRTAHLIPLLELRRRQLDSQAGGHRGFFPVWSAIRGWNRI